jgi:CTP synthase
MAKMKGASSTEIDPKTKYPVIYDIPFDEKYQTIKGEGTSMRLGAWDCRVTEGSLVERIYTQGKTWKDAKNKLVSERHRHRYEVNNMFVPELEKQGLMFTGWSPELHLAEFIELPQSVHPFFLATQAHPEYKSRPLAPHPIFLAFLQAAIEEK